MGLEITSGERAASCSVTPASWIASTNGRLDPSPPGTSPALPPLTFTSALSTPIPANAECVALVKSLFGSGRPASRGAVQKKMPECPDADCPLTPYMARCPKAHRCPVMGRAESGLAPVPLPWKDYVTARREPVLYLEDTYEVNPADIPGAVAEVMRREVARQMRALLKSLTGRLD